jgi:transposase InsO family protein
MITIVKSIRAKQKRLGGRKLWWLVSKQVTIDQQIGRDAFFDLLRDRGLLIRKRKTRAYTTNSSHWLHKYPNLIQEFIPLRANHLWVSDITYIQVEKRFLYLFLITDAYSRKIIGWQLSETIEAINAVKALNMAISQLPLNREELIHHSDRGVQYCSLKYVQCLTKHKMKISMTENGDPCENAIAERVNGILKTEWLYDMSLKGYDDTKKVIKSIIEIYNNERPHSSIEMYTPSQAHQMTGELKRLWKSYKKKRSEETLCQS